jgi:muramoyltetrapeptide carboxypeptidase
MKNIIFPDALKNGDLIAVTAPSSGVEESMHQQLQCSRDHLEKLGFKVIEGNTIWTNDKCVSAPKQKRAAELQKFLLDEQVKAIIPPWGGEFLMEILPLLDWQSLRRQKPKWVLGYSDISTFTFAYTLLTGHATAHGINYFDMHAPLLDHTSARWIDVLSVAAGASITQCSSSFYRSSWDVPEPDTPTRWSVLGRQDNPARFTGRLIGGCLDTISILLGTSYAPIESFVEDYCAESGVIWYMESCEMSAADIYRHLWQMRECGWFRHTNGFIFGRAAGYSHSKNFELIDALETVFAPISVPVIYDADIGHVPPQMTLVNGALAEVMYSDGKGEITMTFA